MVHLKDFTESLKEVPQINPIVEKWLYETREIEHKLSERIILLCQYFDKIPEKLLTEYSDVLIEALNSEDIESRFVNFDRLNKSIVKFVQFLDASKDNEKEEKAKLIRNAVYERLNNK
jgi:hypothetical protein